MFKKKTRTICPVEEGEGVSTPPHPSALTGPVVGARPHRQGRHGLDTPCKYTSCLERRTTGARSLAPVHTASDDMVWMRPVNKRHVQIVEQQVPSRWRPSTPPGMTW